MPAYGDNIVASLSGSGKGKVLLIAHMDTVFKKGDAAARPFRIEGGRAYGPGVSDDKAGIVVALSVLKILDELKFKDYARLTLMLNTNEETGSRGSRALIEKLAKEHDVTLNLEGGRVGDGITIWRKGSGTINVEVKGRASHAGGAPELGRNAAMELAHQMLQLVKLANADKGTTINFTVVKSGDRKNVIPDYAVADADIRARGVGGVRPGRAGIAAGGEEQAHSRHRGDDDAHPQLPDHAAERADRCAGRHGAARLWRDRQDADARRQRRRCGFVALRRRVQADARRSEPDRRQRPHRPRIRGGRQHGAAVLSSDSHGDGTRQGTKGP